jgi:hypothetical protein
MAGGRVTVVIRRLNGTLHVGVTNAGVVGDPPCRLRDTGVAGFSERSN